MNKDQRQMQYLHLMYEYFNTDSKDQVVFLGCFLVMFHKVRDQSCKGWTKVKCENNGGGGEGKKTERIFYLAPTQASPIIFSFDLTLAFSQLYLLFYKCKRKKNKKNQPAIQCGKQWIIESSQNKVLWFINRGTQREYSSKPRKHGIFERILVFKR